MARLVFLALAFASPLLAFSHGSGLASRTIQKRALDLGGCRDAGMVYSTDFGYKPSDTKYFPHHGSQDMNAVTDFICSTLRNNCYASDDANIKCQVAKNHMKGRSGEAACMIWRYIMAGGILADMISSTSAAPSATPSVVEKDSVNVTWAVSKEFVVQYEVTHEWVLNKVSDRLSGNDCIRDPVSITKDCAITFECHGAEALDLLKLAGKKTEFSQSYEEKHEICKRPCTRPGQEGQCCGYVTDTDHFIKMPKSLSINVDNIPPANSGRAQSMQGYLKYDITCKAGSEANCKFCRASATALGAIGWVVAPFGYASGTLSAVCLAAGC